MNTGVILYWACAVLSLYAFYLFAFRIYKMEYNERTDERIVYPRIVYLLALALCFVPIFNVALAVVFFVMGVAAESAGYFYIKSWIFGTPEKKQKADKEE